MNSKKSHDGERKRSVTKIKKDVQKLGKLVGLMHQNCNGDVVQVLEANSNPIGGQNSRQAIKETKTVIDNLVAEKVAKLKDELNISSLTVNVKKSSTQKYEIKEHPAGTVGMNELDTNAKCSVAGKNMIPLSFTNTSADVYGFLQSKGAVKKCWGS